MPVKVGSPKETLFVGPVWTVVVVMVPLIPVRVVVLEMPVVCVTFVARMKPVVATHVRTSWNQV